MKLEGALRAKFSIQLLILKFGLKTVLFWYSCVPSLPTMSVNETFNTGPYELST